MLFSKKSSRKILNLLGLSLLVTALIVIPSLLGSLNFFDLPPLGNSVQAQAAEPGVSEEVEIDAFKMTMGALAGLVLFIYGVTRLAEGLENIAGDRMKQLVSKFTTNRFAGVLTGAVATTLLESSSVTIIMTIAMVSAGLLTFAQSLGVVLGSNIGTTIGAQLISLNINLYAPIAMFIGALLQFAGKTDNQKSLGLILLGLGLLFFGLDVIDEAMKPFREYQPFINLMETLGRNTVLGALIGALFTVLIQSSSATVAIVITLASSGLISLPAGIALMLGAEVGTCADTLVSTIGRGRPALRTGVFHLLFNLTSAIVGIIFASQLAQLVLAISGDSVGRQIANAQVIFNLIGVAAVIGFVPLIVRVLEKLIPDSKSEQQAQRV